MGWVLWVLFVCFCCVFFLLCISITSDISESIRHSFTLHLFFHPPHSFLSSWLPFFCFAGDRLPPRAQVHLRAGLLFEGQFCGEAAVWAPPGNVGEKHRKASGIHRKVARSDRPHPGKMREECFFVCCLQLFKIVFECMEVLLLRCVTPVSAVATVDFSFSISFYCWFCLFLILTVVFLFCPYVGGEPDPGDREVYVFSAG